MDWEAAFFAPYYKAYSCKLANVSSAISILEGVLPNCISLVMQSENEQDIHLQLKRITNQCLKLAHVLCDSINTWFSKIDEDVQNDFVEEYVEHVTSIFSMCYHLGDMLSEYPQFSNFSVIAWKSAIGIHSSLKYSPSPDYENSIIDRYVYKIRKYNPEYIGHKSSAKVLVKNNNRFEKETPLFNTDENNLGCGYIILVLIVVVIVLFFIAKNELNF